MTRITLLSILGLAAAVTLASPFFSPALSAQEPTIESTASPSSVSEGVVVFYFHGNVRCATCRKIEAYADEAIHSGFGEALQDGALTWRVVNIDEGPNKHFIDDFQLVTRSVVLAEYRGGEVVRWRNLDKAWELVRTKDRFVAYVRTETSTFLEAT